MRPPTKPSDKRLPVGELAINVAGIGRQVVGQRPDID